MCLLQVSRSCLFADDALEPYGVHSHSSVWSHEQNSSGGFSPCSPGLCGWPLCWDSVISSRLSSIFQYLVSHVWA